MRKIVLMGLATLCLLLTGCNKENENVDLNGEKSQLEVVFKIPQGSQTRGIIEAPVTDTKPVIKSATVYVLKNGGGIAGQKDIVFDTSREYNGTYQVTFEAIVLSGTEKVVVTANVSESGTTSEQIIDGKEVAKIQPTATEAGLTNVYYRGEETISQTTIYPGNNDGHVNYLAEVDVKPIAARVEITDNIKFNTDLVTELWVSVVTPNNYTNKLGETEKVSPKTDAKGDLWLDLTKTNYDTDIIATGGKSIANHLFAGDEQRIAFQINATVYEFKKNADGKGIIIEDTTRSIKSYIFTDGTKEYVKDPVGEYYEYSVNAAGKTVIATDASTPTLQTYNTVNGVKGGFFNLVNFRKNSDNSLIHSGKYQGGVIYKIKFSEIDWNGDGVIDDNDVYNPGENGGGTEEPTSAADLIVKATVVEWSIENVFPGVE